MNQRSKPSATTDRAIRPDPPLTEDRGWEPYRLSVRQYLKAIDAGVFPDNARVELLGGIMIDKRKDGDHAPVRIERRNKGNGHQESAMTKGMPHNFSMLALSAAFRAMLVADWLISEEKSLRLTPSSRPEPDLAILRGPVARYKERDPDSGDAVLVVEVTESTYRYDRGKKWQRYAAAKIPVYWIVNLRKRQVEVYRDPVGIKAAAIYQTAEIYGEDARVPVVINGAEVGQILVREILP